MFTAENIANHIEFWRDELKASNFVLNVLKFGYYLPFTSLPPPSIEKNNQSSLRHPDFVSQSIAKLLKFKCIKEVETPPYCVNPLTVSEGKKLRLVLDLRNVNPYLQTTKFRYENLKTVSDILELNDYMVTFDLSNGYHHVPMAESIKAI